MESKIDWSKAPDEAMVLLKHVRDDSYAWAVSHSEDARAWHKWNRKCSFSLMASMWTVVAERQTTPSWSGEGLPPVGVVCEVNPDKAGWRKSVISYVLAMDLLHGFKLETLSCQSTEHLLMTANSAQSEPPSKSRRMSDCMKFETPVLPSTKRLPNGTPALIAALQSVQPSKQ